MIDLHTHTTHSDGTYSPTQLVDEALALGLEALAITDHDTLTGFDEAAPHAAARGLDLICGVEVSTRYRDRTVHLLGYFLTTDPGTDFRGWLGELQDFRHRRNRELVARLRSAGLPVTVEELYKRGGTLPGRPHLAALLVERGCVTSIQEAFDRYLADNTQYCVERVEPSLSSCIAKINRSTGIPVLAHPKRLFAASSILERDLEEMCTMGLGGIEVFHSDHMQSDREAYIALAEKFSLYVTGGSDFHGSNKPLVKLGSGIGGNARIPATMLHKMRG